MIKNIGLIKLVESISETSVDTTYLESPENFSRFLSKLSVPDNWEISLRRDKPSVYTVSNRREVVIGYEGVIEFTCSKNNKNYYVWIRTEDTKTVIVQLKIEIGRMRDRSVSINKVSDSPIEEKTAISKINSILKSISSKYPAVPK